jgi:NADH-quinone oxidoreductase subunit G
MATALGSPHVDHRLRQLDFADRAVARPFEMPVAEMDKLDAGLIVGSNLREEMPLLHYRLRQASNGFRKHAAPANRTRFDITEVTGASLHVLNPARFSFNYELASEQVVPPQALVDATLKLAAAAAERSDRKAAPSGALADAIKNVDVNDETRGVIGDLAAGESSVVLMGEAAAEHPEASWLRAAMRFIAAATGAAFAEVPMGANAIGLARHDVLPAEGGLDAGAMLDSPRKGYVLYGAEPPYDFADGAKAMAALQGAEKVLAFTAFASPALLEVADVILPIAMVPETDATLINVDGIGQSVTGGARPPGDVRAGWKALRALGGMLELEGFTFTDILGLRESITAVSDAAAESHSLADREPVAATDDTLVRLATWPIYRADAVLRRAAALNEHPLTRGAAARLNAADAEALGLAAGDTATVEGASLPVVIDADVPAGCVWIEAAYEATATLPPFGAPLHVKA